MSTAKNGFCPSCGGGWLIFRAVLKKWYCRGCHDTFSRPQNSDPKKQIGNITPLTYRQQQVREILNQNAAARERVNAKISGSFYGRK